MEKDSCSALPETSNHLPLWLRKTEAMKEFALSAKRLRQLRKKRKVTHRLEGNEYVYETKSLIDYSKKNLIEAVISEPQREDEKLIQLTKEVIRKEKEKEVREKEESKKGGDNA